MDALPASIGRYEIKAFIARGGMGTLYLATDPVLQRQVAIKLLREADNEELRTRFTREARAAANLRHRNIVTIFDVGEHQGQPFMAMEYIHGQTVHALLRSEPPPSTVRRLQFVEDLCDGLSYAHKRGVVHRDIKPANLMIDAEGTLKILDFGIARAAAESGMTQAGLLVGSLNYMSPEQVAGTTIDSRSDIFAVGSVMYELLTRRQAFPGAIDGGVLNRILNVDPEPMETLAPHLDSALYAIVRRALQKNPAQRYGDLAQMRTEIIHARHALEASLGPAVDETIAVIPSDQTTRVTPTPRRGPDRDEIARRRTQQIEEHVTAARQLLADGKFDDAIARAEQAMLMDQNEHRALDIAERARLQRDEAGAREFLARAQGHLKAGDFTSASSCVREALTLIPESADAVEMGRVIAEAKAARDRERQRAAAVQAALDRGRASLDRGELEAAIAAADEAAAVAPDRAEPRQLKEQAQQAIEKRAREARDREAQQTADDARRLFREGQHAEALALLEQFWPAHPVVSHLWTELSADAARIEREHELARTIVASPTDGEPSEATVFVPRPGDAEPPPQSTIVTSVPLLEPTIVAPAPTPPPVQARSAGGGAAAEGRSQVSGPPEGGPHMPKAAPRPAAARTSQAQPVVQKKSPVAVYVTAAAVLLLLLGGAFYFFGQPSADPDGTLTQGPGSGPSGPPPTAPLATTPPATTPPPTTPLATTPPPTTPPATTPPPTTRPTTLPRTTSTTVATPTTTTTTMPATTTTVPPTTIPVVGPGRGNIDGRIGGDGRDGVAPPPPQVNEQDLIRRTLDAYARAWSARSVQGVVTVYPSVNQQTLGRGFDQARSQTMRIESVNIEFKGNRATVRSQVHQEIDLRAGEDQKGTLSVVFEMEKQGNTWIIAQRR